MKLSIYLFLLVAFCSTTQSLTAQCSADLGPDRTLTCVTTQITLSCFSNPTLVTYNWSGPGLNSSAPNPVVAQPGVYSVTITDPGSGCTATDEMLIVQDILAPSVTANGGVLSCSQNFTTLSASSSTAGVTFAWYGPHGYLSSQQNPSTQLSGIYTVVVTGPNGCTSTQSVTVDTLINGPQLDTSLIVSATCSNMFSGSISINPSGGSILYNYFWSGPGGYTSTSQNLFGIMAGTYTLTMVDISGCSSTFQFLVPSPPPIVLTQTGGTPPNCFGGNTGTISLGVTGGSAPFAFLWSNGAITTNLQNLISGHYSVTVTDINGCTSSLSDIYIGEPLPIIIKSLVCENTLTASVTGGAPPYTYLWNNGNTAAAVSVPGDYIVTVSDSHGCTATANMTLPAANTPSCTHISGHILLDANADCLPDQPEMGLSAWYVKAENAGDVFYAVSNSAGYYDIRLEPGDYTITAIPPSVLYSVCIPDVAASVQSGDSLTVNFTVQDDNPTCPAMSVDLSAGTLRRCFSNNSYSLQYCNNSPAVAPGAYILLTLDTFLSIVSSQRPYTAMGNNVYRFDLGTVEPFDCEQFYLIVSVSCNAVLGQTHCSEAHIFPDSLCMPPNILWSGAEVAVRSECVSDSLHFILKNTGIGPMTNTLNYIVIEDGIMGLQGMAPPLGVGDSMLVSVPANGSTWRIEATQANYFPGLSIPVLSVEGCSTTSSFSMGYVQQFATNDADPFIDVDCTTNIGSYDPNDKQGLPLGYGAAHYIRPNTDIEYLVRFQNTGTDTAFSVVVRDTLAPWLDPTSVRPGGSSHDYQFSVHGNGILVFDFQNILLPDSNVNEAASHGYIKFRVSQRADVPLETDIRNQAAIYFDFNEPVLTNTTIHRVGLNFLVVGLWQPEQPDYHVQIAPHPLRDASWLEVQGLPEQGDYRLRLYDATGRPVREMSSASPRFRVEKAGLPGGMYMFRVDLDGAPVGRGVMSVQ